MRAGENLDRNTWGLSGPYHGNQEGLGRAFFWVVMLAGAMALALPWLDLSPIAHKANRGHHVWLALSTNLLCLTAIISFIQVYRALSKQIARGGPETAHLGGIRVRVASMTTSLLMAGVMLHMCGVWFTR